MRIGIIGTGYVGLTTGVGFALKGHNVVCVDIDEAKVKKINQKRSPIYEKGLAQALKKVALKKLKATIDCDKLSDADVVFVCVGTPSDEKGEVDLSQVTASLACLIDIIKETKYYPIIVIKSTVPPGTTTGFVKEYLEKNSGKTVGKDFGLAFNPEFLREGTALEDFLHPDRVVIGTRDKRSRHVLGKLYEGFGPIIYTTASEAEMIKYASNAFLATKISFINEIGMICKPLGIDVYKVADGIGADKRIGRAFLDAGLGWGGSCFPKDVRALNQMSKGLGTPLLDSILLSNEENVLEVVPLLHGCGKKVAVLGLTFKPETDDQRESQSYSLIHDLLDSGFTVTAFDPKVKLFTTHSSALVDANSAQEAIDASDAVIIATAWPEFKKLNYGNKPVIDTRRLFFKKRPKNYHGLYW